MNLTDEFIFYTYDNCIELNGRVFPAGELSASFLNISSADYAPIHDRFERVRELENEYKQTQEAETLWELNEEMIDVHLALSALPVLPLILSEDDLVMFSDVRVLTQQYSLFPDSPPRMMEVAQEEEIERYRLHGEAILNAEEIDQSGDEGEDYDCLSEEQLRMALLCWERYESVIDRYDLYLHDIRAFIPAIRNFMRFMLHDEKRYDPESYAEALHFFYYDERIANKLIVNPIRYEGDCYTTQDKYYLSYVPRLLPNDRAAICLQHQTGSLQALMKADYMLMMNSGYQIRRCNICEKYFLLKGRARALYCEGKCPLDSRFTCRQFGTYEKQKELAKDNPKIEIKVKSFERISKDLQRKNITQDEAHRAKEYVRDRLYDALRKSDISLADFEDSVSSDAVYAACKVSRKEKRRGRPPRKPRSDETT